jgi:predicted metal-binding membrane protein
VGALIVVAGVAWVATAIRMSGMDAGPATDPGAIGFYMSTWTVMMAAMMLPSMTPQVAGYRATAVPTFLGGYLFVWVVVGLVGYGVLEAGRSLAGTVFAWDHAGRWTAAAVLALAAAYELTPAKRACLSRCRAGSSGGSVHAGLEQGALCLGCCSGLMVALYALGEMSLLWMAVLAVIIGAQKLLAKSRPAVLAASLVLVALAIGVAAAPERVPGLTVPGSAAAMRSMRSMGAMGAPAHAMSARRHAMRAATHSMSTRGAPAHSMGTMGAPAHSMSHMR